MTARLKQLLAISTVASMAFTATAEATVVTPEVVKPQVVTPHVTTAPPAPAPAAAPAPSEPQAPSAVPSPSSPAELPPPGQGPPNPTHNGRPVGYTCPNSLQCEERQREEEDAERTRQYVKANDLNWYGILLLRVPYAVAVAMQANIYDLWPSPPITSVGGAASEVRDQIAGGVRLLQELLLKLKKN